MTVHGKYLNGKHCMLLSKNVYCRISDLPRGNTKPQQNKKSLKIESGKASCLLKVSDSKISLQHCTSAFQLTFALAVCHYLIHYQSLRLPDGFGSNEDM